MIKPSQRILPHLLVLAQCFSIFSIKTVEAKIVEVTSDLTYASKYMTDGFTVGGGYPVFQPSVNLGIMETGVSLMFWSALQLNRSNQNYDELDFFVRYGHDFFSGRRFSFNLHGYLDYWLYPKNNVDQDLFGTTTELPTRHGNKVHAGVSLTELIPLFGSHVVPSYNFYYLLYWADNQKDKFQGGARHELMVQYYHSIPRIIPGVTSQYVGASGTLNYQSGLFGIHSGISHSTAQVTTGVYALGLLLSASLNHQWTYQPQVNLKDETWTTLALTKQF